MFIFSTFDPEWLEGWNFDKMILPWVHQFARISAFYLICEQNGRSKSRPILSILVKKIGPKWKTDTTLFKKKLEKSWLAGFLGHFSIYIGHNDHFETDFWTNLTYQSGHYDQSRRKNDLKIRLTNFFPGFFIIKVVSVFHFFQFLLLVYLKIGLRFDPPCWSQIS